VEKTIQITDNPPTDMKARAGKVVEFVGLLFGFIVIAVVNLDPVNYTDFSIYLTYGFSLAIYCLVISVFYGLLVLLDNGIDLYDFQDYNVAQICVNKVYRKLQVSIFFCFSGLLLVSCIVIFLVSKSLNVLGGFIGLFILTIGFVWVILYDGSHKSEKKNKF